MSNTLKTARCGNGEAPATPWDAAIIDIDGTLVLGDAQGHGYRPLPGANALLDTVRDGGLRLAALTNGTLHTSAEYVAMLASAGLDLAEHEVLTPASVAAHWYRDQGVRRVLVLGSAGVWKPLQAAGLQVVLPPEYTDAAPVDEVLVGWHPEFRVSDLEAACRAVWAGAKLGTTSMARFFATSEGRMIGLSNAITAGITSTTGVRTRVFGKPSALAMRIVLRHLSSRAVRTVVIGDDPTLEIAMARRAGSRALGVLTGIGTAESFAAPHPTRRAEAVFKSAEDVARWIRARTLGAGPTSGQPIANPQRMAGAR
jgi:HAD superfamily hydrolase (TIGR01450 family)